MEETLAKLTEKGLAGIESLEKVTPQLIQEYLRWELISTSATLVMIVLIMSIIGYFIKKAYYEPKERIGSEYCRKDWTFPVMICGGVALILLGIVLFDVVYNLLQIIYAPKVYLLNQLTNIIK